jgi:hypothetical protein
MREINISLTAVPPSAGLARARCISSGSQFARYHISIVKKLSTPTPISANRALEPPCLPNGGFRLPVWP